MSNGKLPRCEKIGNRPFFARGGEPHRFFVRALFLAFVFAIFRNLLIPARNSLFQFLIPHARNPTGAKPEQIFPHVRSGGEQILMLRRARDGWRVFHGLKIAD